MAFIPVPDTAHVRLEGRVDAQQVINDLYFRHTTGPIAAADLGGLLTALASWQFSSMAPLWNEAWSGVQISGRDLTSVTGFVGTTSTVGVVGGTSGEAAPNNCTMAVSFRSALAGRSFRGRNYVPVLTNSQVTGNLIDTSWQADVVAGYSELIFGGGALPAGWVWVVVSRFTNSAPRTTGIFSEIFNVIVTDNVVDSQRRRLPGRGK